MGEWEMSTLIPLWTVKTRLRDGLIGYAIAEE